MSPRPTFNINHDKALEVVVWLASNKPDIDIYHIAKVLYYADKKHLNRFGRPIVGDNYKKMDKGPAPSLILDIVNHNSYRFKQEYLRKIGKAIRVSGTYKNSQALRQPDLSHFSKSDILCLEESLRENGNKGFWELYDLTHKERDYIETEENDDIDYILMVDDENPHAGEIRRNISENSKYISC
jgi:uncharacterized phage-associated protein